MAMAEVTADCGMLHSVQAIRECMCMYSWAEVHMWRGDGEDGMYCLLPLDFHNLLLIQIYTLYIIRF